MSRFKLGMIVAVCAVLCSGIVFSAPRPAPQSVASLANDPKLIEDLVKEAEAATAALFESGARPRRKARTA